MKYARFQTVFLQEWRVSVRYLYCYECLTYFQFKSKTSKLITLVIDDVTDGCEL